MDLQFFFMKESRKKDFSLEELRAMLAKEDAEIERLKYHISRQSEKEFDEPSNETRKNNELKAQLYETTRKLNKEITNSVEFKENIKMQLLEKEAECSSNAKLLHESNELVFAHQKTILKQDEEAQYIKKETSLIILTMENALKKLQRQSPHDVLLIQLTDEVNKLKTLIIKRNRFN